MKRWILAAAVTLAFAASPADAAIIDCIVATVNDQIVTQSDVKQAMIPYLLQNNQNPAQLKDPRRANQVMEAALQDLIERKLIEQEARKIDYNVPDEDLDKWLEFTRSQQNLNEEQFKKVIEQQGLPYSAYREMVRQNLLKVRIINIKVGSQVSISPETIDARYRDQYGADSGQVPYRTISHILVRPTADTPEAHAEAVKRADAIHARIAKGEAFPDVASAVSEGSSGEKKGLLGTYRKGELDPEFEAVAFAIPVGQASKPVRTKFGYHIVFVSGEELRDDPEVEQRKEMIHAELRQAELERLLKQYMSQLKTRSFIEVKSLCAAY